MGDMMWCVPFKSAWDLHQAWPESKLIIDSLMLDMLSMETGIVNALLTATDEFALL
jgi:proline iminopeptidase